MSTQPVIICNWNDRAAALVCCLRPSLRDANGGGDQNAGVATQDHAIVVVADNVGTFPDDPCFGHTTVMPGSPLNRKVLERVAMLHKAQAVIILADPQSDRPDDGTLRVALEIRRIVEEKGNGQGPWVVAEVCDSGNAAEFRRTRVTGINEVICEDELGLRVLAQASISPGVTFLLQELLDFSGKGRNHVYLVEAPDEWGTGNKEIVSFKCIVNATMDKEAQSGGIVLGLARREPDGSVRFLLAPKKRQLEGAKIRHFHGGDWLVVLAPSRAVAHETVHGRGAVPARAAVSQAAGTDVGSER